MGANPDREWRAYFCATHNSREGNASTKCPDCGRYMDLEEKDTSSGRDMRTYRCRHCGRSEDVDYGIALWQVLSDAREADEVQSRNRDAADVEAGEKKA